MGKISIPSELEMLARAGYNFREGFTGNIRYTQIDEELPFPKHCLYEDGTYVLGPEKGEKLLVTRDLFNSLDTLDISQTETPGVLQVITQHVPMGISVPAGKNNARYLIHMLFDTMPGMLFDTMPGDIDWKTFDLKTYNKVRYEHFR